MAEIKEKNLKKFEFADLFLKLNKGKGISFIKAVIFFRKIKIHA